MNFLTLDERITGKEGKIKLKGLTNTPTLSFVHPHLLLRHKFNRHCDYVCSFQATNCFVQPVCVSAFRALFCEWACNSQDHGLTNCGWPNRRFPRPTNLAIRPGVTTEEPHWVVGHPRLVVVVHTNSFAFESAHIVRLSNVRSVASYSHLLPNSLNSPAAVLEWNGMARCFGWQTVFIRLSSSSTSSVLVVVADRALHVALSL